MFQDTLKKHGWLFFKSSLLFHNAHFCTLFKYSWQQGLCTMTTICLDFLFHCYPERFPLDTSILIPHCHAWAPSSSTFLQQPVAAAAAALPSSLKVKRPIWGKSLNVSRQIVPAVLKRAMQTWSCFTKRGRVLLFSPVFLSTKQIKACIRKKLLAVSVK